MESKDITSLRLKMDLSQEAFAKIVGVSWRTIWRWEKGYKPSQLALIRLKELEADVESRNKNKS